MPARNTGNKRSNETHNSDIERLRQTEKPTLPLTIVLTLFALFYVFTTPELQNSKLEIVFTLCVLNVLVLLFQTLIVPSKHYNQFFANLEAFVLTFFSIFIIHWTGGFNSPFFFTLYLILLSTPVNEIIPPLLMGFIQVFLLFIATLFTPSMLSVLTDEPFRAVILILSPAGIAFFTATMLYETITQKREKEKAQQLSDLLTIEKTKLENVLSNIKDIIIACDIENKVILANNSLKNTLGIDVKYALGRELDELLPQININEVNKLQEITFVTEDKNKVDSRVIVNPLTDRFQNRLGVLVIIHDIGEEKDLERMKLDFVTMATHELRTPLTSIKGYLSFLKKSVKNDLSTEDNEFIDRIQLSTDTLSVLIENILSISNIERKTLKLDMEKFELDQLILSATNQFKVSLDLKNQLLKIVNTGKNEEVYADRLRINEVLSNLLENAVKFTPENGVITVTSRQLGKRVEVCVEDNGVGIPKDSQKHLFEKFYRVSGYLQAGSKGTGLGLYICKAIIELHNEKIWFESEEGKGTRFYFTLPLAYNF